MTPELGDMFASALLSVREMNLDKYLMHFLLAAPSHALLLSTSLLMFALTYCYNNMAVSCVTLDAILQRFPLRFCRLFLLAL